MENVPTNPTPKAKNARREGYLAYFCLWVRITLSVCAGIILSLHFGSPLLDQVLTQTAITQSGADSWFSRIIAITHGPALLALEILTTTLISWFITKRFALMGIPFAAGMAMGGRSSQHFKVVNIHSPTEWVSISAGNGKNLYNLGLESATNKSRIFPTRRVVVLILVLPLVGHAVRFIKWRLDFPKTEVAFEFTIDTPKTEKVDTKPESRIFSDRAQRIADQKLRTAIILSGVLAAPPGKFKITPKASLQLAQQLSDDLANSR